MTNVGYCNWKCGFSNAEIRDSRGVILSFNGLNNRRCELGFHWPQTEESTIATKKAMGPGFICGLNPWKNKS